jgi:hypothetical protein
MKKVSILLLLTTVLAAFSFAQVTVVGGFQAGNVTAGNKHVGEGEDGRDKKMDPTLWTEFYGAASQELGPGSVGVELGLGAGLHFTKDEPGDGDTPYDNGNGDVYLKGSYSLPAGPGELAFGVSTWHTFSSLHLGVDYDGIVAGPATVGFGLEYAFNTTGQNDDEEPAIFGDKPEKENDKFTARLSADFDFGLGIVYKFRYFMGEDSDIDNIAYLDVNYKVMDPLVVGIELDNTGKDGNKDADLFKGFQVKPYGNYSLSDSTTLGIFVKLANIGNDVEGNKDIEITPGLTIKHVF